MRRCLHAFFTGLLTFSLVTAPAHACWRSRQARHCRPVQVMPACPPPAWTECCEPCDSAAFVEVPEVEAACDCCPSLPVAADCCEEAVVVVESQVQADEVIGWVEEGGVVLEESQSAAAAGAEPTLAAEATAPPSLESIAAPPALEQAGGVTRASNDEPLTESPLAPEKPAPAVESVLAEPEMRDEVESREDVAAADSAAPTPAEPPMEVEPEPAVEEQPEVPVEPAPQEPNIFEELDAREAPVPPAGEKAMTGAGAADPFAIDSPEPAAPSDASPPPANQPVAPADEAPAESQDAVAGEEAVADEEMATDEPAAPAEPADPFAADDAAGAEDPAAPDQDREPTAADPFAAAEEPRRWIDATGTGSIVATLVAVAAEDHCVLETRGRRVVVPLENLSRHDRDYVRRAGVRLATHGGQQPGGPAAVHDTAGL